MSEISETEIKSMTKEQNYLRGYSDGKSDVLDKIRADIEQLPTAKCTETQRIYIDAADFKENVLAILDKYKAESEDKE